MVLSNEQLDQSEADSVEIFLLAYNEGLLVQRAIESVLTQTYKNIVLTVLVNGTSDQTRSAVQPFLADNRVRIIRNERNIQSGMANPYMLRSSAKWISLLFADDYYIKDRVAIMLSAAETNIAVFSNSQYYDENNNRLAKVPKYISTVSDITQFSIDDHLRRFWMLGNSLLPASMMVRSDAYRLLGGFPLFMHCVGDMYFFALLLASYPVKLIPDRLNCVTVWTDKRNESARSNYLPLLFEDNLFRNLYTTPPLLSRIQKIFPSHLEKISLNSDAERLWYLGMVTLADNVESRRKFAFSCLYRAIQLDEACINQVTLSAYGVSAGVYIGRIAESQVYRQVRLRHYLYQFKLMLALRKLVKNTTHQLWAKSLGRSHIE